MKVISVTVRDTILVNIWKYFYLNKSMRIISKILVEEVKVIYIMNYRSKMKNISKKNINKGM